MYVLFKKKRGIYVAILVYSIVEHNGKLMLSLYIPMALDEASVQIPDAFILPSHQIHLDQVEIGFFVENRARFLRFS